MTTATLPVPVLASPHWRVRIRPSAYNPELLPTLGACLDLVQATKLSLRGWDYPHLSHKSDQVGTGNNWAGSWVSFTNHIEYWRMYQSGQFLHLFVVREAFAQDWKAQLRDAAQSHALHSPDIAWDEVPGYLSMLNALYTITEIFEFGARISQRGVYNGAIEVSIELVDIKGFILTPEKDRAWSNICRASEPNLGRVWQTTSQHLVAASSELSLAATMWFFERFGWIRPNEEVLRRDQAKFLTGRR